MNKVVNFDILIEKYKNVFVDILGDMELTKIENGVYVFEDDFNQMTAKVNGDFINFRYKDDDIEKAIVLKLPDENDKNSSVALTEIVKEKRQNGCIIDRIVRLYGYSSLAPNEIVLLDILSKRYAFIKDVSFEDISDDFLENESLIKNVFESHMKTVIRSTNDLRWLTSSKVSSNTKLNGTDISDLYDIVEGKDKISRIYDLYKGVINKQNSMDILAIHLGLLKKNSFGYKEISGISAQEDIICGKKKAKINDKDELFITDFIQNRIGYEKPFDCTSVKSLIEAITYNDTVPVQRTEEKFDDTVFLVDDIPVSKKTIAIFEKGKHDKTVNPSQNGIVNKIKHKIYRIK